MDQEIRDYMTSLQRQITELEEKTETAVERLAAEILANGTVTRSIRRRGNVSTSTKGVRTPDHTIDTVGYTLEEWKQEFKKQDEMVQQDFPFTPEVK